MADTRDNPVSDEKYISANGLKIHYREWGSGRPLVLLHGATETHALWSPFLPTLTQEYRVITPDSRGHGRTVNPEPHLSYQMMGDDLAGFIRALDLDSPLIFGYSDGGQAALDLGIHYPDLPGALVIGGVWVRFSRDYQNTISAAGFVPPGEMDFDLYEKQAPADWEERLRRMHRDPRPEYPRILLANLAELWWTPLGYSDEDFRNISAPVLILMGEKDEAIPLEEARELAKKIPRAELAVIPGAGHNDVIVCGGAFLEITLGFLRRLAP